MYSLWVGPLHCDRVRRPVLHSIPFLFPILNGKRIARLKRTQLQLRHFFQNVTFLSLLGLEQKHSELTKPYWNFVSVLDFSVKNYSKKEIYGSHPAKTKYTMAYTQSTLKLMFTTCTPWTSGARHNRNQDIVRHTTDPLTVNDI